MGIKLGMEARLYRNTDDYAAPTWVEVTNVKDVTLNLEKGEAAVTTRANQGWRATVGTLKDASVEFQMVWDTNDPAFAAIQQAFFNNTTIEFAVMDGAITDPTSEGLRATHDIFNFTRNENLEEAIMVDVSIKPTYADNAPEWISGGP